MESACERPRIIRLEYPFLVVLLASMFSCARSAPLEILLARIDQSKQAPALSLYLKAIDSAYSTDEKLRVLKRLRKADPASISAVVSRCSEKQNTEPVVLALIDYCLDASRFSDALDLFNSGLSCRDYPELYAEIVLSALKNGRILYSAALEDLHSSGIAASQPALLYGAALKCMATGNFSSAGMFLSEASDAYHPVPKSILWDTGLFDVLLRQQTPAIDDESYLYLMSAAYSTDKQALAANFAGQYLQAYPDSAWQACIALGVLAFRAQLKSGAVNPPAVEPADIDWPHWGQDRGYCDIDNADFWFAEAFRRFPDQFDVLDAWMKWRLLSGDTAPVSKKIDSLPSDDRNDRIRFLAETQGASSRRTGALAVELAARYPDSPETINLVLFTLFREQSWDNFIHVLNQSKTREVSARIPGFYDIAAFVCNANPDAAVGIIENETSSGGYAAIYNLGLLQLYRKDYAKAAVAMKTAATKSTDDGQKVRALIHLSYIARINGNLAEAESYKRSAISLDPECLLIPENSALIYGE